MKRSFLPSLLLALALLLTGCAPADPVEAADGPADAVPDASVPADADVEETAFALPYEPAAGFNPYDCMSQSNRTVLSLAYEPLFSVGADFEAVPYLCESMESSGDGRTHTLVLRPGVTFSDGTALTAGDVAASLEAARDSAYYGGRLSCVSLVTVAAPNAVTIVTDRACGSLDELLNIYIVKEGTAGLAIPTGTGPYALLGSRLCRAGWWRDEAPPMDDAEIALVRAETAAEIRDSFEYAEITLANVDPNAGVRLTYHADFELWTGPTTTMQYIGFNLASPVFTYSAVRTAVAHMVDRDAIAADLADGFAVASALPAPPGSEAYDAELAERYGYDPEAFSRILDDAAIADRVDGDGVKEIYDDDGPVPLRGVMIVCIDSEQRVAAAQLVVDALNAQGFDLELKALEAADYQAAIRWGNYDLYYGETRLSPNFDLTPFFRAGGSLSVGGIADSALDLLCTRMLENVGNAYDLHQRVMDRGLLCPVLFKTNAVYSARGSLSRLSPCLDGVFTLPISEEAP